MPLTPGRPPPQKKRKPGRKKTKLSGPWGQKGTIGSQIGKELETIKIPKKRGPKPGSKARLHLASFSSFAVYLVLKYWSFSQP